MVASKIVSDLMIQVFFMATFDWFNSLGFAFGRTFFSLEDCQESTWRPYVNFSDSVNKLEYSIWRHWSYGSKRLSRHFESKGACYSVKGGCEDEFYDINWHLVRESWALVSPSWRYKFGFGRSVERPTTTTEGSFCRLSDSVLHEATLVKHDRHGQGCTTAAASGRAGSWGTTGR